MSKKDLLKFIEHLEFHSGDLHQKIHQISAQMIELLEENNKLRVENDHLRERLELMDQEAPKAGGQAVEKKDAYSKLVNLYHDGFHICNDQFGRPRQEDCLFCTPFLAKFQQ